MGQLNFVTQGPYSKNIGSRTYLMESSSKYKMFKLVNKEFTFDTDVSQLDCGLNGALYFAELQPDGGMSEYSTNECGAKFGTGYCDAQCPHDMKWISGEANSDDWKPSDTDPNSGTGKYGSCCNEMDIWESNKHDCAFTPHVCNKDGPYRCSGTECGDNGADRYKGVCDKDGCDLNAYRAGNTTFFGPGSNFVVDSSQPMTLSRSLFLQMVPMMAILLRSSESSFKMVKLSSMPIQISQVYQSSLIHLQMRLVRPKNQQWGMSTILKLRAA